mgnify:CR=1 FL=1
MAEKEISNFHREKTLAAGKELLTKKIKIKDFDVLVVSAGVEISSDDLRSLALDLRSKLNNSVVVLYSPSVKNGKVTVVASSSPTAVSAGIKAGALVKMASATLGGGGGGKDDFAQGGGPNLEQIDFSQGEIINSITNSLS